MIILCWLDDISGENLRHILKKGRKYKKWNERLPGWMNEAAIRKDPLL